MRQACTKPALVSPSCHSGSHQNAECCVQPSLRHGAPGCSRSTCIARPRDPRTARSQRLACARAPHAARPPAAAACARAAAAPSRRCAQTRQPARGPSDGSSPRTGGQSRQTGGRALETGRHWAPPQTQKKRRPAAGALQRPPRRRGAAPRQGRRHAASEAFRRARTLPACEPTDEVCDCTWHLRESACAKLAGMQPAQVIALANAWLTACLNVWMEWAA
eukprot:362980-Chlamydomonas_euryale.AAC.5